MEEPLHLPDAPNPPEEGDCCGNGCEVCVHDMYAAELAEYRRRVMEYEARQQNMSSDTDSEKA
ncbi:hypothetical protein HNQ59_002968 [Chitinivorax tropicus]|uniref:Oxidoreductase-like domain-containing protein n=1 Tax=Chitinivorax tropicus TaxID=714531 RepID=A0A840MML4_9PROT|nr:oxidoreductase-like domain-containing protein [Chitinivorax tropicus]MBB5019660.1 hypothetical protein [Chitinivorax tropicus]